MKTLDEFRRFYETDLLPVLRQFEQRRRKALNTAVYIIGAVVVLVLLLLVLAPGMAPPVLIFAVAIGAIATVVTWQGLTKGFRHQFKEQVVGEVVWPEDNVVLAAMGPFGIHAFYVVPDNVVPASSCPGAERRSSASRPRRTVGSDDP